MDDLEYVVRKQEQQRICFGSSLERDTWSRKGMTPFMKRYTLENNPNVSPNKYNVLDAYKAIKNKPCSSTVSQKGYGGVARFAVPVDHAKDYPSPTDYSFSTFPTEVKPSKYPFASTSTRKSMVSNNNPGPGMYTSQILGKRGIKYDHSFGGRAIMKLGVELKCCRRNTDVCELCGSKPCGDYWHRNNKVFLCRPCMQKERVEHKLYKNIHLDEFRKLRDCSEIHRHEGTDAKIWLMHPRTIQKWNRCEAYLSAYLKD